MSVKRGCNYESATQLGFHFGGDVRNGQQKQKKEEEMVLLEACIRRR